MMERIIEDFYKSVIYDNRYMIILKGLKNTIIIAIGSVVIGIILGLLIAVIKDKYEKTKRLPVLAFISKLYVTVIRGTPALLQLMIIYSVIFKSININPVWVGILAFGINSGAYVSEIIRAGIWPTKPSPMVNIA